MHRHLIYLPADSIIVPENRLRPLDDKKVEDIAKSIEEIGLQHPISLYVNEAKSYLVAGAHRLAAIKKLGICGIQAFDLTGMPEVERRLWEIDENLRRKELTPDELRLHLQQRKMLWEEQQRADKNNGTARPTNKKRGQPKGFAASTAEKMGVSKRTINRAMEDESKPKEKSKPPASKPSAAAKKSKGKKSKRAKVAVMVEQLASACRVIPPKDLQDVIAKVQALLAELKKLAPAVE